MQKCIKIHQMYQNNESKVIHKRIYVMPYVQNKSDQKKVE